MESVSFICAAGLPRYSKPGDTSIGSASPASGGEATPGCVAGPSDETVGRAAALSGGLPFGAEARSVDCGVTETVVLAEDACSAAPGSPTRVVSQTAARTTAAPAIAPTMRLSMAGI